MFGQSRPIDSRNMGGAADRDTATVQPLFSSYCSSEANILNCAHRENSVKLFKFREIICYCARVFINN